MPSEGGEHCGMLRVNCECALCVGVEMGSGSCEHGACKVDTRASEQCVCTLAGVVSDQWRCGESE